jgi:hypothetical protein
MSIGLGALMCAILVVAIAFGAQAEDRVAPFVGVWRGTCENFVGSFEKATSSSAIERTVLVRNSLHPPTGPLIQEACRPTTPRE